MCTSRVITHPCHSDLPADVHSLIGTPRIVVVHEVHSGHYVHFCVVKGLNIVLNDVKLVLLRRGGRALCDMVYRIMEKLFCDHAPSVLTLVSRWRKNRTTTSSSTFANCYVIPRKSVAGKKFPQLVTKIQFYNVSYMELASC
ncbi:hypothetical protein OUZ56_011802 [Daphnia magna]|uniref:Uncharacterized protein n=1 Tax=Daphnia magna TaxID=35525 RepID=A0ABQ9Z180_9CRUS|nr:hypothetical protein OUZ56_011802 [Daphnia magna]